jgi:hypothetical protein
MTTPNVGGTRSQNFIRSTSMNETVIRRLTGAPVIVAISGSTARSSALTAGDYYVRSSVDCFLKQGTVAVNAATTDNPIVANEELVVRVSGTGDTYIAAITSGASGSLYIKSVEAV